MTSGGYQEMKQQTATIAESNKQLTQTDEHIIEIVSDSGEGAQTPEDASAFSVECVCGEFLLDHPPGADPHISPDVGARAARRHPWRGFRSGGPAKAGRW